MEAIDSSLKRLKVTHPLPDITPVPRTRALLTKRGVVQTDYVDLYQLHAYDTDTPLEETFRTLNDLVRAGKVRCAC